MKTGLLIAVIAASLCYIFVSFSIIRDYHRRVEQLEAKQVPSETQTDIVMFCQELAAKTNKEGWSYKSCVQEVSKTLKKTSIVTL